MQGRTITKNISEEEFKLIESFEKDIFCNKTVELLTKKPLQYRIARKLVKLQNNLLEQEITQKLIENSNLKKLHSAITNERGCHIFLLLDYSLNLSQLANRLKTSPRSKDVRSSIRYWLKIYEQLGLIKPSTLHHKNLCVWEKKENEFPRIIKFLNYVFLINLKNMFSNKLKANISPELLERDFI